MKLQISASISLIAAAVMFASCASHRPAPLSDYQQLADNANKQIICKRQAVTGSRIESQVCFTQAQLKEQQEHAIELMRDMQQRASIARSMAERPPQPPPSTRPGGQ